MSKVIRRWWDEVKGWGDVVVETEHWVLVRFDADPWTYEQIPKEDWDFSQSF